MNEYQTYLNTFPRCLDMNISFSWLTRQSKESTDVSSDISDGSVAFVNHVSIITVSIYSKEPRD